MSTFVVGNVIIDQDTVYSDNFIAEAALFDVAAGTTLLLLGDDQLNNSAIGSAGEVRADDALTINGLALTDDATFVNISTLTQVGLLTLGISPDDAVEARNLFGATWDIIGDGGFSQSGAGSSFVNFGLFEVTAGVYDVNIDADFIDRGSGVVEAEGALAFDGPVTRIFGDVTGSGRVTADEIFLDGATVSVSDFDAQTVVVRGVATITSAVVDFSSALDTGALYLRPTSTLRFEGQNITLGNVYGVGEIDLQGTVSLFTPTGTPLKLVGDLKLVNSGEVFLAAGSSQVISLWSETIHGGTAEIDNLAGATWRSGEGEPTKFVGDGTSNTFFDNAGVFEGGYENTTFEVNVVNDGSFEYGGEIFDNPVSGTGTINAYPSDSALTFNNSVGAGQTIVFSPYSVFAIEDVPGFAGVISDFDQGSGGNNSIGFGTSVWQYQDFAPDANGTGGALIFSDGASQTSVKLSGTYDPADFHAAIAGNQTVITYG